MKKEAGYDSVRSGVLVEGTIVKGIAGFYYVHDGVSQIYECKAKGIFRKQNIKPMVGDRVMVQILDAVQEQGNLVEILPRKNRLIRPAVANVDQALLLFAAASPAPNLDLLDRMLISMDVRQIPSIICFGKTDLVDKTEEKRLLHVYEKTGIPLLFISNYEKRGMDRILDLLEGKTTAMAGPSGVGKSSLLNQVVPDAGMETGAVSEKIQRGRHTTRHSQLFYVKEHTFLMDTPGFGSLDLTDISCEQLRNHYPELNVYEGQCRFHGCVHIHEPGCAVRQAVETGDIPKERYDSYHFLYDMLKAKKKY